MPGAQTSLRSLRKLDRFPDVTTLPRGLSLDHLVGAGEQHIRHGEPESLGSVQVNYQFVLVGSLYWKISWFFAFENAIDVAGGAPILVKDIRSVGDQTPLTDKVPGRIDRGQSVPRRQTDDQIPMMRSLGARR